MKYKENILKQNIPLFIEMFGSQEYNDDFGHSLEWNKEMENWLSFAQATNSTWYNSNKSRVKTEKQRDELLAECKSIYYFGKILSCKVTQFEPSGNGNKKNDYAFEDKSNEEWFTEVKSPSWRGEVSKNIDNIYLEKLKQTLVITNTWPECKAEIKCPNCSSVIDIKLSSFEFTLEELYEIFKDTICESCKVHIWHFSETERAKLKKERLSKPQIISGEVGSFSDKDAIEDAVKKSVNQFAQERNNLLVIAHNMLAGIATGLFTSMNGGYTVEQIIQKYDKKNLISCVCLLDVQLDGNNGAKFIPVFVPVLKEPLLK
jgi:hypothetical protein